jgi:hypothetical protein
VRELMAVRQVQLAQDGGRVALDRAHRHAEHRGDLVVQVAAGDVLEDLAFARCQRGQPGVLGWCGRPGDPVEGVEREAGQARREDRIAARTRSIASARSREEIVFVT